MTPPKAGRPSDGFAGAGRPSAGVVIFKTWLWAATPTKQAVGIPASALYYLYLSLQNPCLRIGYWLCWMVSSKIPVYKITTEFMAQQARRNEPCHCGSGKKYKNCCQGKDQASSSSRWLLIILAVVMVFGLVIVWLTLTSDGSQTDCPPGTTWSEEHQHCH